MTPDTSTPVGAAAARCAASAGAKRAASAAPEAAAATAATHRNARRRMANDGGKAGRFIGGGLSNDAAAHDRAADAKLRESLAAEQTSICEMLIGNVHCRCAWAQASFAFAQRLPHPARVASFRDPGVLRTICRATRNGRCRSIPPERRIVEIAIHIDISRPSRTSSR
ncbi:hypothetical protein [Burkholderia oklahomensis]|uniref:hypothetical protein n=1 Tax=Burkholderia oklahomensis TaxID=342113 RepID=UPI001E497A21|nr:hypothetical protein [Burkholderia oklahomensis]